MKIKNFSAFSSLFFTGRKERDFYRISFLIITVLVLGQLSIGNVQGKTAMPDDLPVPSIQKQVAGDSKSPRPTRSDGEKARANLSETINVRLNYSGPRDRGVRVNTLLELHVQFLPSETPLENLVVEFGAPSGKRIVRDFRPTTFAKKLWIAHISPMESGRWTYVIRRRSSSSSTVVLAEDTFEAYDRYDSLPSGLETRPKANFRVLYNNDGVNVVSPVSSSPNVSSPFDPDTVHKSIQATVDEVAGTAVDIHLLSASFTWVPWWRSEFYSMDAHWDWFRRVFENVESPDAISNYVLEGGDFLEAFIEHCRLRDQLPFVSFRLNDHHNLDLEGEDMTAIGVRHRSRFYHMFPEYRLGTNPNSRHERVLNWAIPEVRGHILSFIHEVISKYEIGGLELDFMRHTVRFPPDVDRRERDNIVREFIKDVRFLLDEKSNDESYLWLVARLPVYLSSYRTVGVELEDLSEVGVDMVVLAETFHTEQQGDYAEIKRRLPDTSVYLEMTHAGSTPIRRSDLWPSGRLGPQLTTDSQFYTTAHLAYTHGLDGVSLFNFVYFRGSGRRLVKETMSTEPPFQLLDFLDDPEWLAARPQHYFISRTAGFDNAARKLAHPERERFGEKSFLLSTGESASLRIDMQPPLGGWKRTGRMRLHGIRLNGSNSTWRVTFNGEILEQTDDVSQVYASRYNDAYGVPGEWVAWRVPADLPKAGVNVIGIQLIDAGNLNSVQVAFVELGFP